MAFVALVHIFLLLNGTPLLEHTLCGYIIISRRDRARSGWYGHRRKKKKSQQQDTLFFSFGLP